MKIIKNFLIFIIIMFGFSFISTYALDIDHFEVTLSPERAQVWEALDITIKAVDKNWETVKDYNWSILVFSGSDAEAEFPNVLSDNSYKFEIVDEWKVKFENAIKFKNPWKQDLHIYDLNDENIFWVAEVEIFEKEHQSNIEVNIISPENGLTIWQSTVKVSWTTNKNHQVEILVNSERKIKTTTNSEWIFDKNIWELKEWENSIITYVLDSDGKRVWESDEVKIMVKSSIPSLKSIQIDPNWKLYPESEINVKIFSNNWLSKVKVILNDIITNLEEKTSWVYSWKIYAPKELWTYYIDLLLKDDLWHETKKTKVEKINVIEKEPDLSVAIDIKDSDNDWILDSNDNCIYEINKDQKDTDWDSIWDACDNCINIKNKNQIDANKNDIWDVCEKNKTCISQELNLAIRWLKLTKLKTKSILTWNKIKWAWSYNIYKRTSWIKFELIDNVIEPRYSINIIWDKIKYDYFSIKAVWKDNCLKEVEWKLSDMIKIKTWPEEIFLLIIAILFTSLILFIRRKKIV